MSKFNEKLVYTVGIHPHKAKQDHGYEKKIIEYFEDKNCIAIGEIGLDYFYEFSEKKIQWKVFEEQIKIASDFKKNIIVHCRSAEQETLNILKGISNINILIHCYTGNTQTLKKMIENNNYFFSVGGMITFKKNDDIKNILNLIPENKLLIESDSPYLTPTPYRGKLNMPEYVKYTYKKIAEIKNMQFEKFDKLIENNYRTFNNNV
jgi:TatD DNase family protein